MFQSAAVKTKLSWEKFAAKFSTWAPHIKPFFESGGLDPVLAHLKKRSGLGHVITPESHNLFRAFRETPYEKVSVVILGMCPYHTLREGKIIADGLCLGNSLNEPGDMRLSPFLDNFYAGIERDVYGGLCVECYRETDLSYLSRQGVLLLNAALTTEIGIAGAHQSLWRPFTDFLFSEVIAALEVPVVFLGKEAAFFEPLLPARAERFVLQHPASSAYSGGNWSSGGAFTRINRILEKKGGPVEWLEKLPF